MIALQIGKIAEEKGLSIQDIADRAGISHNTARGLYRGYTTRLDLPILDRICTLLEVTPGELLVQVPDNETVGIFKPKKVEQGQFAASIKLLQTGPVLLCGDAARKHQVNPLAAMLDDAATPDGGHQ